MAPFVVIRSGAKYVEYRETRAEWMRLQHLKLHESVHRSSSYERDDGAAHARPAPASSSTHRGADPFFDTHDRYDDSEGESDGASDTDEHQRLRPRHRSRFRFGKREHRTRDDGKSEEDNNADDSDGIDAPPRPSATLGLSTELFSHSSMHGLHCAECGNLVADRDDIVAKTFFGRTGKAFLMNSMFNVTLGSPRSRYLMTGMHTIADVSCSVCASVLGWKYIKAMEASQQYKEGKFIVEKALVEDADEEQTWQRQ